MLAQQKASNDSFEDEFNKPVESIMRCEDFKSNFARKLSNRYISWSPAVNSKRDPALKLCQTDNQDSPNIVPERIEQCSQLSTTSNLVQNGEVVKPPDKTIFKKSDIRRTEVNALNMEVDTLRWQLAQTEANRQMHIALLQQIVTFLNRVKEHIECQKNEPSPRCDKGSPRIAQRSLNMTDLPRSRSVVHVNKNIEYSISPTKKISTRKISKSISNVNGYKDCSNVWSRSKLSLVPENETANKLSEEMTRLITLANTVLSTKIPDLACAFPDNASENSLQKFDENKTKETGQTVTQDSLNFVEQSTVDPTNLRIESNDEKYKAVTNSLEIEKDALLDVHFNASQASFNSDLRNDSNELKCDNDDSQNRLDATDVKVFPMYKKSEFNPVSNFIEDESGFSSMNSFQEIGIPIISIIPPSPCKDITYMEDIPDIIHETEKWKADSIELDKQSVKVFWV
ncbi:uncharacterized protein LOC119835558 isoform X1 [Zerene cesonia]|uniref:uncharacterized protein LOC119835558 isoform X1 n=1 Tax=Zerene cesonia TaxID=33412 RepID=UPI0018E52E38|nr:uncharacterized protein LOC119835558 isoform X1 [Zerene cesonia]